MRCQCTVGETDDGWHIGPIHQKCEPFATVRGADQVVPPRSENLSTAASPLRSIQLRSNRFPSTLTDIRTQLTEYHVDT